MKFICSLFLLAALATPALAQNYKNDIFVAFSDSAHPGFMASYAYSPAEHLAVEGDLSIHHRGTPKDTRYHLNLGPRVLFRTSDEKIGAYGHFMIGFSHIGIPNTGDTSFSWVLGGGAEYNFTDEWAGRFQVDLVRTHWFGGAQNTGRYSFGVVYRFE
jgi:hypothetical protein